MTNWEKNAEKLKDIACNDYDSFAVKKDTGEVIECGSPDISCNECEFKDCKIDCYKSRRKWLDEDINMTIRYTLDNGAYPPEKAHDSDAGYDLRTIEGGKLIDCCNGGISFDTGVHVEIPMGYVGYVQGRSGLNHKHDIICPTGTIDSGYTGSIKVKLYNHGDDVYTVHAGDKIAQLVIQPLADCELVQADKLEDSERGENGIGSTGR